MDANSPYYRQVQLLVRTLPQVATENCFALKGGTAINLFMRDMPRLSVDIDLAYLPLEAREQALPNVQAALARIVGRINSGAVPGAVARLQAGREDELRILVNADRAQIKVEVSPVMRGTLHVPIMQDISPSARRDFGFASIAVVSPPDLYGGKICAALDRQHPRDWFDVMQLLDGEGLSRAVFDGFLLYLVSHGRPMNELLAGRWKPLAEPFERQFRGMTAAEVTLAALEDARDRLLQRLRALMTEQDKAFLLSLKTGEPEWRLFGAGEIDQLPAVQWKLLNIRKMKASQRHEALTRLQAVLAGYGVE